MIVLHWLCRPMSSLDTTIPILCCHWWKLCFQINCGWSHHWHKRTHKLGLSYILLIYHKSFFQLYAYFFYTSIYNVTNYKYFDVGLYCYCYNCMLNLMILLYWKSFKWLISFAKQETILKKKKTMLDEFILMCLWICFESSKHG